MPVGSKKSLKYGKALCALVAAVLLLFFACIATLPTLVSSDWGKQKLFNYLRSQYQIDVQCQHLSLKWFGHLEASGLQVIYAKKKVNFTCDTIKTEASLYSVLIKKNFGHLFCEKPYLKISPSLLSLLTGRPQAPSFQKASFFPIGKMSEPWLRCSLPYIGVVNASHGKMELLAEELEPIVFDEIVLNLENTPAEHTIYAHLSCQTLQKGIQGSIQADVSCMQVNSGTPILKANASLSQLPVEGVDELFALFQPKYRGFLVQAIGPTADASLNAASAAGNFEIDVSTSSPLFSAKISMATKDERVSLLTPAQCTYTITPAFFEKLSSLDTKKRTISLKENGTLNISLQQFNSVIPHSFDDLLVARFDATIAKSTPLVLESNGVNFTLRDLYLQIVGTEGAIQYNGQASVLSAQKSADCSMEGVYNAKNRERSFSVAAKDLPTEILAQIVGLPVLPDLLGQDISISASVNKTTDHLLSLEAQTPLFKLEKAVFSLNDKMLLRSPVAFSYQLLPSALHLLTKGPALEKKALLQGYINNFSLPLSFGLEGLQLDLKIASNQIQIAQKEPIAFNNAQATFSVRTLNQISLGLSSDRLQASLTGKYNEKTGKVTLTQPLLCTATIDNALLHGWVNTPASLMKPADLKLSIDPFSFTIRAFSMQSLSFKGTSSIPFFQLLSFEGAPELSLNNLVIPFQWDGPQKAAQIAIAAQVQEKEQSLGSIACKSTFTDVQWGKWDTATLNASLELQQMPTQFIDSFLGKSLFSPIIGPQFSTALKLQSTPQQHTIHLTLSSALLNIKSAFTGNATTLALSGPATSIQWTLTPEGYKSLDTFLNKQNSKQGFALKEPTYFQIHLTQLQLPFTPNTQAGFASRIPKIHFDLSHLQCVGDLANPSIIFSDNVTQETLAVSSLTLAFNKSQNTPLTFACNAYTGSPNNANNGKTGSLSLKGNVENLFDKQGQMQWNALSSQISLSVKNFPSQLLDLIARFKINTDYPFTKIFGNTIQASLEADIRNQSGPLSLNVHSPNTRFSLDAAINQEGLILKQPVYAQMKISKEMSALILNKTNPALRYFYSEGPVTLEIPTKGFFIPFTSSSLMKLSIPNARIELGKIACRNEGNIHSALSLLKAKQFDKNKEVHLWFAPIDLHVSQGTVDIERTEILLANTFDIAVWGKLLLLENYVDMVLGLTAQTLNKSFGIKNLSEDYVLTIPVQGKIGNVQINSSKATKKIALLLASQQKVLQDSLGKSRGGQILGGILQHMATLPDNENVPPAKHPFPWEKKTGFEESTEKPHEKKIRFKENEKPFKQLLKIVK